MSSQQPLESPGGPEKQKRAEHPYSRLHGEGLTGKVHHPRSTSAEKHVGHMALVDKHGHPVDHIHRVKKGETVSSIAHDELRRHYKHTSKGDVTRYSHQIIHSNDLKRPYTLHPGQELLIPKCVRHHNQTLEHRAVKKAEQTGDQKHLPRQHKPHDGRTPVNKQDEHIPKHHAQHVPKHHPGADVPPGHKHRKPEGQPRAARRTDRTQAPAAPAAPVAPVAPIETSPAERPAPPPAVAQTDAPRQGRYGLDGEPGPVVATRPPEVQPQVAPVAPPADVQPPVAPQSDRPQEGEGNVERKGILAGKIIAIDPGHGGTDSGEVAGGIAEKNVTPLYAAMLKQKLEALGAKVVLTRPLQDDPRLASGAPELQRRANVVNASHADLVIRLHANATENKNDTTTNGMEAWWDQPKDLPLTRALHDAVAQADRQLGVADRGVKQRTAFFPEHYKFQPTAPSALIEVGYLSNARDRAKLMDPQFQNATADAIVAGLTNYYSQRR